MFANSDNLELRFFLLLDLYGLVVVMTNIFGELFPVDGSCSLSNNWMVGLVGLVVGLVGLVVSVCG